ncbi:methyl-accepting chemotaxis protein [Pelagicoccus sp. SDUM812005]|uniref:HAMP domain-containing methyl-accepting chemotaxis protein n=1 Tax=Pelagicoccus sp. SDUM812005 TaxID=3041257 RepID=UPI00280E79AC|nr:methyl-accepting chemotaxis protein [Pelagicoccus sp. SDUM812005]MDQ8179708.1 methyl-accepting chemotaxis protein [Pelagicoccus sp. SDUM812005]
MINSQSIRTSLKFACPTLAVTAVAIVIGTMGLKANKSTNLGLERVYQDRVLPLQELKSIADAYAVGVIDAANKANAGIFTAEKALEEIELASRSVKKNWELYFSTHRTEQEEQLRKEASKLFVPADAAKAELRSFLENQSGYIAGELERFDGPLYKTIDPISNKINELVNLQLEVANQEYVTAKKSYDSQKIIQTSILLGGSLIGLILTFTVSRSTLKLINGIQDVASRLGSAADESNAAAQQISTTSQMLAEQASEQAASLEETSASMQHISTMTVENSQRSGDASALANEVGAVARISAQDMQGMVDAMCEIESSSSDISAILKTIDEIAFQTNILALNAAVEAARAGKHGAGFSVVAEEVRNLAARSAQAAGETAAKIESSLQNTAAGVERSHKVAQSLEAILCKIESLTQLVQEVADATRCQSEGISKINQSIGDMERATQANAASAEEGATSSEELSAQVASVRSSVQNLLELVNLQNHAEPLSSKNLPHLNEPRLETESHRNYKHLVYSER